MVYAVRLFCVVALALCVCDGWIVCAVAACGALVLGMGVLRSSGFV